MTVLFRDGHDGMILTQQMIYGLDFTELLYADDTALITTTAPSMNKLVAKIDTCSLTFGLNLITPNVLPSPPRKKQFI